MKREMKWLKERSQKQVPVTFGAPWGRGELPKGSSLALIGGDGKELPCQVKPTAYWPDGSIKWTAHSAVLDTCQNYTISLSGKMPASPEQPVSAFQDENGVTIESGLLSCRVEYGDNLISSLVRKVDGFQPMSGKLVALIQNEELHDDCEFRYICRFEGVTQQITLEESGPVRAVVKVEGLHRCIVPGDSGSEIFPFSLRLYFYACSQEVKIVHSFVFDINEHTDFLKGLALELTMEVSGEFSSVM